MDSDTEAPLHESRKQAAGISLDCTGSPAMVHHSGTLIADAALGVLFHLVVHRACLDASRHSFLTSRPGHLPPSPPRW